MKKYIFSRNLILLSASLLLCTGIFVPGAVAAEKGAVIIEAMGTEPTNLDIFKAARQPEYTVLHLMFESLFVVDPTLKVQPLLVESHQVSDDQKTWTFVIRKGIKFHDGTPLNAEAVKFSFDRHMAGSQGRFLKVIESITVTDPMTVAMKLKQPFALLLNVLASPNIVIASPTAFNQNPQGWGSKTLVGTGPMMFKEWRSGDRVVMARNPEYKHGPSFLTNRGPAKVEGWEIRFLPEPTTLISELTAGDVDLSDYVTERDVKKVSQGKNTELFEAKSTSPIYLAMNTRDEPFNDKNVRIAAAHAVNAEAVRKAAMSGIGAPLFTPISPMALGFHKPSEEAGKPLTDYSLEKAKQMLEAAGWKDANGDGVREKNGKELAIEFLAFNIARYKRMAEVATPMLQEAGFKVNLQILEAGDLYQRTLAGKHHLLSTGLVGSQGFAVDDLVSELHTESLGTVAQWCLYKDEKMDKLLDTARYNPDPKEREKALNEAQMIAAQEVVVIPIANSMEIFGYKKALGGVESYIKHPWAFNQADEWRALEIYRK
jgi:peptide/nickel transport system substrate-binding protein